MRHLNDVVAVEAPGALVIAEESTAWPGVSRPTSMGGLGFHYKWNMGWMHDSLHYFARDPIHRRHHHNELTFDVGRVNPGDFTPTATRGAARYRVDSGATLQFGVIDTGLQAQIRETDVKLFPNKQRFIQLKDSNSLSDPDETGKRLVHYLLNPNFGKLAVDDLRAH